MSAPPAPRRPRSGDSMRRGRAIGPPLVLAVALTGCAGSGRGSETAEAVTPATYVHHVCRALVDWHEEVGAAFSSTDARPDSDRPVAIRKDMLDFFDAVQAATDAMRRRIDKVGAPSLPDDRAAADGLERALAGASDELRANRTRFAAVPLSDVQPAASIEGAMTVVGEQLAAIRSSVLVLDGRSPELRRAREADGDCKRLREFA